MPAPKNNTNAAKPASERSGSILTCRVNRAHKALWVRAAKPSKLSPWVISTLNTMAARSLIEAGKAINLGLHWDGRKYHVLIEPGRNGFAPNIERELRGDAIEAATYAEFVAIVKRRGLMILDLMADEE